MIQTDATPHRFFKDDDTEYALHGFIDDATGKILGLYMCKNECMQGYLEITRQMLKSEGIPEAIYADGSSIFFPKEKDKNKLSIEEQLSGQKQAITQYGKMMDYLGIRLIHAGSSQAKGRVERMWNTLHDRLRTEFKMHNITTIEEANKYLIKFIKKFNNKFSVIPESNKSAFVELPENVNLDYLLSVKKERTIDASNSFSLNSIVFKIDTKEILHKKRITICISQRMGIKAYYEGKFYNVTPIDLGNKKSFEPNETVKGIIDKYVYFYCLKNERLSA